MSDDLWKMATGYETPDDANAALVNQAEEIARLRAALKPFADAAREFPAKSDTDGVIVGMNHLRTALKALEGT